MWGVKWLTNGGSDQAAGAAQPTAAAAPQPRIRSDDAKAAAESSQQPSADPASKSDDDHGNGHAPGQHETAEGSHIPPGVCS